MCLTSLEVAAIMLLVITRFFCGKIVFWQATMMINEIEYLQICLLALYHLDFEVSLYTCTSLLGRADFFYITLYM